MRLGAYPCRLVSGSAAADCYESELIQERHRHRYEFNNTYMDELQDAGLLIAGKTLDGNLVEGVEIVNHPWFVGCQFHPEFQSRPVSAHPLFRDFVRASLVYSGALENDNSAEKLKTD